MSLLAPGNLYSGTYLSEDKEQFEVNTVLTAESTDRMMVILTGLTLAAICQLAAPCCSPVKMQGIMKVSSRLIENGEGISSKVCNV